MAVELPIAPQGTGEDAWVPTACDMCYNGCTIRVHRVDGVAVKIEGIPDAGPNYGATCAKGVAALMNVYSPHRVTAPAIRTNPVKGIGVGAEVAVPLCGAKRVGGPAPTRSRARTQLGTFGPLRDLGTTE